MAKRQSTTIPEVVAKILIGGHADCLREGQRRDRRRQKVEVSATRGPSKCSIAFVAAGRRSCQQPFTAYVNGVEPWRKEILA